MSDYEYYDDGYREGGGFEDDERQRCGCSVCHCLEQTEDGQVCVACADGVHHP